MTTFDATAPGGAHAPALNEYPQAAARDDDAGFDALALLKQTVKEREEIEPLTLVARGGSIRIVCDTDIPEKDLRRWQRAALPAAQRSGKIAPSPLDQDQLIIATKALTHTALRIEVRDKNNAEKWHVIERAGETLGLDHDLVLRLFNAVDVASVLVEIFGRESDVIRASQEVLAAAGWSGENGGGEDEDPR